jgi:hypothetical protein
MALSAKRAGQLLENIEGVPIGKILCIAKAALKFVVCWTSSGTDTCVKTLIADIEKCLKK